MLFTIIIPVYNVEEYIRECLDSILSQTCQDFEIICVDDGSTDGSGRILDEYAQRYGLIKVIHQNNSGTAAARNSGVRIAKGDYIWFVDGDDWVLPDSLSKFSGEIEQDLDVLCFAGKKYYEISGKEEKDPTYTTKVISGWEYYNRYSLLPASFSFVCVVLRLFRRKYILDNDLFFSEDFSHEDNMWVPIALYYAAEVKVIDFCSYVYRIRGGSKMSGQGVDAQKDIINVANRLASFFVPLQEREKTTIYRAITHHYQVPFSRSSRKDDKELLTLIDWKLYKAVSRTKARHRLQYLAMRIGPCVFRMINKI